jgi:hypothetical protein
MASINAPTKNKNKNSAEKRFLPEAEAEAANTAETPKQPKPLVRCAACAKECKSLSCAVCRGPKYCSKDCQKVDWSAGHKIECKLTKAGTSKSTIAPIMDRITFPRDETTLSWAPGNSPLGHMQSVNATKRDENDVPQSQPFMCMGSQAANLRLEKSDVKIHDETSGKLRPLTDEEWQEPAIDSGTIRLVESPYRMADMGPMMTAAMAGEQDLSSYTTWSPQVGVKTYSHPYPGRKFLTVQELVLGVLCDFETEKQEAWGRTQIGAYTDPVLFGRGCLRARGWERGSKNGDPLFSNEHTNGSAPFAPDSRLPPAGTGADSAFVFELVWEPYPNDHNDGRFMDGAEDQANEEGEDEDEGEDDDDDGGGGDDDDDNDGGCMS